jgi:tRNA-dihydrouridine synthase B
MSLLLAPLHGFTELAFRNIYFRHFGGIDEAVAPFISLTHGDKITPLKVRELLPEKNTLVPVIPQILGNNADDFILIVKFLSDEYGYKEINWNLGCPISSIVRKKRGSGMLPYPELIASLLDKILPAISPSLSIKMRLGYDDVNQFPLLIEMLNKYPLSRLIIHPRIGIQQYCGEVKLDIFKSFIPSIRHQLVYNGDIHSHKDYEQISSVFPSIKDYMLGRGVFYNPFLPEQINAHSGELPSDAMNRFRFFYTDLETSYKSNRHFWMSKMKEFWKYFGSFLNLDEETMKRLMQCNSEGEWVSYMTNILTLTK